MVLVGNSKNNLNIRQDFKTKYGKSMQWLMEGVANPEKLGYDEALIDSILASQNPEPIMSNLNKPDFFDSTTTKIKNYQSNIKPLNIALNLLENVKSDITYIDIKRAYFVLERVYYVSVNRTLEFEDMMNIYFSGLFEKIMVYLDKFDEVIDTPTIDSEFLEKLSKVQITDEAKSFNKEVSKLLSTIKQIPGFGSFQKVIDKTRIIYTLAAFNTIRNNEVNMNIDDIVVAYKTYFKLLQLDLSQYLWEEELVYGSSGYIVCKSCGAYYELEIGDDPDDFTVCDCGGSTRIQDYYDDEEHADIFGSLLKAAIIILGLIVIFSIHSALYLIGFFAVGLAAIFYLIKMLKENEKRIQNKLQLMQYGISAFGSAALIWILINLQILHM